MYSIIKDDLFNISARLKSVDKNYFIVFNHNRKKFEIHYKRAKNTYELTVPYEKLDARTVALVQKTKIGNQKEILKQIEENNKKIEINKQKNLENNIRSVYGI